MKKKDYSKQVYRDAVKTWQKAGLLLEKVREKDIENANTEQAIASMKDLFEDAIIRFETRSSSGLVEQQYWFKLMAQKLEL